MNILEIKVITKNRNVFKIDLRQDITDIIKHTYYELKLNTKLSKDIKDINRTYQRMSFVLGEFEFINEGFNIKANEIDLKISLIFREEISKIKNYIFIKTDASNSFIDLESFLLMINMSYTFETDEYSFQNPLKWLDLHNENKNIFSIEYIKNHNDIWELSTIELTKESEIII